MMPMRLLFSRSQRASANPSSPGSPTFERHQRRNLAFDQPMQCGATLERTDPKILPGEIVGQQLPLRRLVLDHDDMGPRIHRLPAGELATICRLGKLCRGPAPLSSFPPFIIRRRVR